MFSEASHSAECEPTGLSKPRAAGAEGAGRRVREPAAEATPLLTDWLPTAPLDQSAPQAVPRRASDLTGSPTVPVRPLASAGAEPPDYPAKVPPRRHGEPAGPVEPGGHGPLVGMPAIGFRGSGGRRRIGPDEFALQFRGAFRTLWTIAAGVVNDPVGADDVVQEAALTALGKLDEFEPHTNFTAWMAKIVRYVGLNHARRDKRQPAAVDPVAMDDAMVSRPGGAVGGAAAGTGRLVDDRGRLDAEHAPFDDRLMRALASVGETARACLLLRTIEDLSYDEIARLLDIPPGTAMSHVHRTRMLLRQRLPDLDPTPRSTPKEPGGQDDEE